MITLYGIKNCDTMQKAFKLLDAKHIQYTFHDYKEQGIDKATIAVWLRHFPIDKLINLRSTTYRELPAHEQQAIADRSKAIALMMKYTSIIKRPVWHLDHNKFFLGWNEAALQELL